MLDPISERATCDRGKNAAIIVNPKTKRILTTGYVGAPSGLPHCDEVGHLMREVIDEEGNKSKHCIRTNHAEENAILQAAADGPSIRGMTIYAKMTPCYTCAKMIAQVGLKRVVARERYHADRLSLELLRRKRIKVDVLYQKVVEYDNQ